MGQLKTSPLFRFLVLPALVVVIGIIGFFVLRLTTQAAPAFISNLLNPTPVFATTRSINGYTQVVMIRGEEETILTEDRFNNVDAFARGEYVVWVRELPEENQVVRYYVPTRQDTILASGGVFERPRVDPRGNAVWQRWEPTADDWYISLFQNQKKDLAVAGLYPDILDNKLMYVRKNAEAHWELVERELKDNTERVLAIDPAVKQVWFDDDRAYFPGGIVSLEPSPTPKPEPTPPPFIDTAVNPPDMVEGEPSRVPPGDERLFSGEMDVQESE